MRQLKKTRETPKYVHFECPCCHGGLRMRREDVGVGAPYAYRCPTCQRHEWERAYAWWKTTGKARARTPVHGAA